MRLRWLVAVVLAVGACGGADRPVERKSPPTETTRSGTVAEPSTTVESVAPVPGE